MAFNNYPVGFQPIQYYPQYSQAQYPQNQQMTQPQNCFQNGTSSIIWVQGETGAKSYLVPPNSTIALWDSENPVVYLKSADASGMPSMKIIDYKIRDLAPQPNVVATQEEEYITRDEFMAFEERMQKQLDLLWGVVKKVVKKRQKW